MKKHDKKLVPNSIPHEKPDINEPTPNLHLVSGASL